MREISQPGTIFTMIKTSNIQPAEVETVPVWEQPTIQVANIDTITGNSGSGPSDYSGERTAVS